MYTIYQWQLLTGADFPTDWPYNLYIHKWRRNIFEKWQSLGQSNEHLACYLNSCPKEGGIVSFAGLGRLLLCS